MQQLEQLANSPGFLRLRDEIISLAQLRDSDRALDVGAGTGLLTLAAAPQVRQLCAIDSSPAMCSHLRSKLRRLEYGDVDVMVADATALPLQDSGVDVVLSNYCLHHLRDAGKHRALAEAHRVLAPGGRILIGDMMFRLTLASARDRAVIGGFVSTMLRSGPAGLRRLLANLRRLIIGRGEHPRDADWWRRALEDAGFEDIAVRTFDHEGGIAHARRPG